MFAGFRQNQIDRLVEQLSDPSDTVCARAEKRLMRYADRAVPRLQTLANHPDPRVRFRVVWLLGKSQCPAAYRTIVERIEDSDARVAYDAIMALGEFGDLRSIPLLQELASRLAGRSEELLGAALMALAKLGVEVDADEFNLR